MGKLILVMAGGALGAGARYAFWRWTLATLGPAYPWGTLGVNLLGGLLMGMLVGGLGREAMDGPGGLLLGAGVLGGFTTFSAFSLDVVMLIDRGAIAAAALYAGVSGAGSVFALIAGMAIVRQLA